MSYTALYRKFRPAEFEDVKGQDHIITTLKNQIKADRIGHAYLFCGTRGTGKTTVVQQSVKALEKAVKDEEGVEEALATEDIQLLALNIDKKYDVRGAKSPAYILQVINGDKITRNKAAFSVKEFDKLANEGEYELKIEDPNQDDTAEETEYVYVGAMRFTDTDTKTYVTTVKER